MLRKGKHSKIQPCIMLGTMCPWALSKLLQSSAAWRSREKTTQISSVFLPPGLRLMMSFLTSSYRNIRREYGKAQNHQVGLFGRGDSENTGSSDALCLAELWLDGTEECRKAGVSQLASSHKAVVQLRILQANNYHQFFCCNRLIHFWLLIPTRGVS